MFRSIVVALTALVLAGPARANAEIKNPASKGDRADARDKLDALPGAGWAQKRQKTIAREPVSEL